MLINFFISFKRAQKQQIVLIALMAVYCNTKVGLDDC